MAFIRARSIRNINRIGKRGTSHAKKRDTVGGGCVFCMTCETVCPVKAIRVKSVGNLKWIPARIDGRTRYVVGSRGGYGASTFPPGGKEVLCDYQGRTGDDMIFPDAAL